MRRMIEVGDGVRDAGEQEGLRAEDPDIRNQPSLAHHGDLQHEHERRHQRDHSGAELRIFKKVHVLQNRKVEINARAPRMKAIANSSGTRNRRILALVVSTTTMRQQIISSFSR